MYRAVKKNSEAFREVYLQRENTDARNQLQVSVCFQKDELPAISSIFQPEKKAQKKITEDSVLYLHFFYLFQ